MNHKKILFLIRPRSTGGEPTGTRLFEKCVVENITVKVSESSSFLSIVGHILSFRPDLVVTGSTFLHKTVSKICNTLKIKHLWWQRTKFPTGFNIKNIKNMSEVACGSEYIRSTFPGDSSNIQILMEPIDRPSINEISKNLNMFVIGFCGSYTKQKNPKLFIEIAKCLQIYPCYQFIMCGDNCFYDMKDISSWIGKEGPVVQQFGLIKDAYNNFIPLCDLLICPATEEGFGRTLVESANYGVPFLAMNDGGHIEVARNLGCDNLLVDSHDPSEWAYRITRNDFKLNPKKEFCEALYHANILTKIFDYT